MDRRRFLRSTAGTGAALALGPGFWRAAFAAQAVLGPGPYGPLGPPDPNGLRIPEGFTARVIARTGESIGSSGYVWHREPDGGATFPTDDGGWIYVSNSEVGGSAGGVGAVRFAPDGLIVDTYPILAGSNRNCAGGATPWGTWLSCEEIERGQVWECHPAGEFEARPLPALGLFMHEAVAVDDDRGQLYLTEDRGDGRLYRFTPTDYPDLGNGVLQAMRLSEDGGVTWLDVGDPLARQRTTRRQVPDASRFNGGEGCWFDSGHLYWTTKGDGRVWDLDVDAQQVEVLYDPKWFEKDERVLQGGDNIIASSFGDLYVAEDGGNMEVVVISADRREVAAVVEMTAEHRRSEVTGLAFDPSGTRLYAASQRGADDRNGVVYEIEGPWRQAPPTPPPAEPSPEPPAGAPGDAATSDGPAVATEPLDDPEGGPELAPLGVATVIGGAIGWAIGRRLPRKDT